MLWNKKCLLDVAFRDVQSVKNAFHSLLIERCDWSGVLLFEERQTKRQQAFVSGSRNRSMERRFASITSLRPISAKLNSVRLSFCINLFGLIAYHRWLIQHWRVHMLKSHIQRSISYRGLLIPRHLAMQTCNDAQGQNSNAFRMIHVCVHCCLNRVWTVTDRAIKAVVCSDVSPCTQTCICRRVRWIQSSWPPNLMVITGNDKKIYEAQVFMSSLLWDGYYEVRWSGKWKSCHEGPGATVDSGG